MGSEDETRSLGVRSRPVVVPPNATIERGASIGPFIVIERLGEGGMGVVASAFDATLNRRVALKVVHPERAGRGELLREAQAMAQVTHPNVVTVYQVGELGDGDVFIAMELVEGVTLATWLATPRSWREILRVFAQAGRGLAAAHRAGIVHRDFKPDNVMVGSDGRARVGDFGLAGANPDAAAADSPVLAPGVSSAGTVIGTPLFMAPEQYAGVAATARADQFAFGVALYLALYKVRPFAGEGFERLRTLVLAGDVREPPRGHIPARFWRAIRRALSADPKARFASMDAVIDELERPPIWRRRGSIAAAGVVLAAALVVTGAEVRSHATDPCADGERALVGIWDPATRIQARAALTVAGRAFGGEVAARVEDRLDRYATGWLAARHDVCESGVHHEASALLGDRRMACLRRRLAGLAALTTLLRTADEPVAQHAVDAAADLPELAACADDDALAAAYPPPDDHAAAARAVALGEQLARVHALRDTGKIADARAALAPLLVEADALAYPPTRAVAHFEQGALEVIAQDATAAAPALAAALPAAADARDDGLVAQIWVEMLHVAALRFDRAAATDAAPARDAALRRAGDPPTLRARALEYLADLEKHSGHVDTAERDDNDALAIARKQADQIEIGRTLSAIAGLTVERGNVVRAEQLQTEAVSTLKAAYGSSHPAVAAQLGNLGSLARLRGDHARAAALYAEAMAICEADGLADAPCAAAIDSKLAALADDDHDDARAMQLAETAVAIYTRTLGATSDTTLSALTNLALMQSGVGHLDDARAEIERAIAGWTAVGVHTLGLAQALGIRASIVRLQGHVADAVPDLQQALAIRVELVGENNHLVAEDADQLGGTLRMLDRAPESCAAYDRAQRIIDTTVVKAKIKDDVARWEQVCAKMRAGH